MGTTPRSDTGASLAARWNVDVRHALYRKTGDWYHQLERFPGALLDENGYVVFETEEAFRACPELRIRQDVSVPGGIAGIPGYTRVIDPEGKQALPQAPTTYEKAIFREGALADVVQSRRERDPEARATCIDAHGYACAVCAFDFARCYGSLGERFIHVHHLKPLADGEREVDPVADMRPVCPNCHAMLHRRSPPLTIDELRSSLRSMDGPTAGAATGSQRS